MPPFPRVVARKGPEGPVPEVVHGLLVASVAHRRGQVQRDLDPAAGEVPGRSHQVTKVRKERRPRADLETSKRLILA